MRIIYNKIIPFQGYKAINLFGIVFVRNECKNRFDDIDTNHESIHAKQMKELLFIPFYLFYLIEWFIKWCVYMDSHAAYRAISFEREAYSNEANLDYNKSRKHFAWLKRIIK
jgi:hypothetical protein